MYILFGAGKNGKDALALIGKDKVAFFLDNDKNKIGTEISGIRVYGIEMKKNELSDYCVVITAPKESETEIQQQLMEYGIRSHLSINERLYSGLDEYYNAISAYRDFVPSDAHIYYAGVSEFSTKNLYPDQYKKEYDLIMNRFLPMMPREAYLADVGCADGHWTHEVSKHCMRIDGFDYSESLISTAKNKYENETTHFFKWDARRDEFNQIYDGILLFGLLMYIFDDDTIYLLLEKLRNTMKGKGILLTKDTLNITEETDLFSYNPITGYSGRYMNQNNYYKLFIKSGFRLLDDSLLMMRSIDEYGRAFVSRGTLWEVA